MTVFFPSVLDAYPAVAPYVAQIPPSVVQGDSAAWVDVPYTDVNGVLYDSSTYGLKYTLAGPIAAPVVLIATVNGLVGSGSAWQTTLTPAVSAGLAAGLYGWTAQIFGANVRLTIATGEFTVNPDLALVGANYDTRTFYEKALAEAEAALATYQQSGGRIKEYTINDRHMTFQDDAAILKQIQYWRSRVVSDRTIASGGMDRMILTRFNRAR